MAATNDEKNLVTKKANNQLAIQAIEQAVPIHARTIKVVYETHASNQFWK